MCFSPVGSTLRVRSRKFPAIINCTAINWFHEWPQEALMSVSKRFLEVVNELPENYRFVFLFSYFFFSNKIYKILLILL